ncbi:HET-domain-containing protein [Hypomontagnella submonticulosa]|nr:HET-domain-containing protein [Hypomontagnella submonticulosa]
MRLLHVHTRELEEYNGKTTPPYAILSHTWGAREVNFQDISKPDHKSYKAYAKIEGCCQQAIKDGLSYVWIDTCCIDKSSSAELSEGINSMFQWYKKSTVCYIYLADVSAEDDPFTIPSEFRDSRWWTRGWTLQELLAPMELVFFDKDWNEARVGRLNRLSSLHRYDPAYYNQEKYRDRLALLNLLSDITNIPKQALDTGNFSQYCAAARLAWAASRETTRVEDRAYSLLGLLEVNMPLLYGEGHKAFLRLQEEVVKSRNDDSLLAWGYRLVSQTGPEVQEEGILARSPSDFIHCHSFQRLETHETSLEVPVTTSHSAMTNIGMWMAVPIRPIDSRNGVFIAILRCRIILDGRRSHLAVPLVRTRGGDTNHFSRAPGSPPFLIHRTKLLSLIKGSKFMFFLSRTPFLWKLFVTKPISTPIYLREAPTAAPPQAPWPKSRNKECETMGVHISELLAAGYEVASFYPPWISRKSANCLVLRLGSPSPAGFIIVFSKPREFSTGYIFIAVYISLRTRRIARVGHGSALEYLMEQSRGLEVDMKHHGIQKEELELSEEAMGGSIRSLHHLSFKYMFGDVRIKCIVERTYAEDCSVELDRMQSK